MKKAIYVEDDHNLASNIIYLLQSLKINVSHFTSGTDALYEFSRSTPDLVILDIKIQGSLDGFDVARIIRSKSQVPILFSTGITEEKEMNKLLKFSNSDHIFKPFNSKEFRLRIEKMFDLIAARQEFKLGNLIFNPGEQKLINGDVIVHLGNCENNVLSILCEHIGIFIGKDFICKKIWGEDDFKMKDQTLLNCISKLRKLLKTEPNVVIESNMKLKLRIIVNRAEKQ
jgi:DNA-binding response OmpR family regulator